MIAAAPFFVGLALSLTASGCLVAAMVRLPDITRPFRALLTAALVLFGLSIVVRSTAALVFGIGGM